MKGNEKQEDDRCRGSKMPKKQQQKIKQLQSADNDSDSENKPIDVVRNFIKLENYQT